jgi:hypothetical protein
MGIHANDNFESNKHPLDVACGNREPCAFVLWRTGDRILWMEAVVSLGDSARAHFSSVSCLLSFSNRWTSCPLGFGFRLRIGAGRLPSGNWLVCCWTFVSGEPV